ncbi:uncharacterized protein TrAtP1_001834 [Trichoderma atroviride]|uniref:uncharacterized protein n=1 Tax=Hypocrea atroviridis TaxID=63577 RepID=UPI0033173C90|nr:hypothetical protein TrAtP1_001834 [Trichoderma atroviride]
MGAKNHSGPELPSTSKIQGSNFIGKNWYGTIVSRHYLLFCFNALLLQCSNARLTNSTTQRPQQQDSHWLAKLIRWCVGAGSGADRPTPDTLRVAHSRALYHIY